MKTKKRILNLTLKKKWFDMILSGEKKEEYREIKPYWTKRFINNCDYKFFYAIKFRNGYKKDSPWFIIELKKISTGKPNKNWIDCNNDHVFILSLGKIICSKH